MADDQIWNFVDDYIAHRIPREVSKYNHPTHQIVLCNDEAIHKYLRYVRCEKL